MFKDSTSVLKLYIIGNGFDLWHNLPTSYENFYAHARDALNEIETYYGSGDELEKLWSDFENSLGTYCWKRFYDAHNEIDVTSESFKPSQAYGLEDEIIEQSENLVELIESLFFEWVSGIDVSTASAKIELDPNAVYLTFNYTDTLQNVYGIPDNSILHIHGKATEYEKLIFGHGEFMEEEPEIDGNGDSNRTIFSDAQSAAKYPFYAFQKPVNVLIEQNRGYFRSLSNVVDVVVIGHSLNDIDLQYFKEVANNALNCHWVVYCFRNSDAEQYVQQLEKCGVSSQHITIRAFDQ